MKLEVRFATFQRVNRLRQGESQDAIISALLDLADKSGATLNSLIPPSQRRHRRHSSSQSYDEILSSAIAETFDEVSTSINSDDEILTNLEALPDTELLDLYKFNIEKTNDKHLASLAKTIIDRRKLNNKWSL